MARELGEPGGPAAVAEARRRIAQCRATRDEELDLSDLGLEEFPDEVRDLSWLRRLDCSNTQVSDLAPLAGLSSLQELGCSDTQVSDLAPLAGLSSLKRLGCSGTQVSDLAPLAGLSNLQRLYCLRTQVSDLAPLAGLSSLQRLYCWDTPVSDLAPLAGLSSLQRLDCWDTPVSDLAPLAGLSSLQRLDCWDTPVSDLAPLAGLSGLQWLNCSGTQVSDLAPLAGLSDLQLLNCSRTQVSDLAPLAGLSSLQVLDCAVTPVSDLAPLAGLSSLQELNVSRCALVSTFASVWMKPSLRAARLFVTKIPGVPAEVLSQQHTEDCLARLRDYLRENEPGPDPERPVPPVPDRQPAAIVPEWIDGRLSLSKEAAANDARGFSVEAALAALKSELQTFADSLEEETNIDRRAKDFLRELAEALPSEVPPQERLFALGHRGETLSRYGETTVNVEWPPLLAARYRALVLQYERTMRRFPEWVAFTEAAPEDAAPEDEIAAAPALLSRVRDALSEEVDSGIVGGEVIEALDDLDTEFHKAEQDWIPGNRAEKLASVAANTFASISNVIKSAAESALRRVGKGASEQIDTELEAFGKAAVKWTRRLLVTGVGGGAAVKGTVALGPWLVEAYPSTFKWLPPILDFLKALPF